MGCRASADRYEAEVGDGGKGSLESEKVLKICLMVFFEVNEIDVEFIKMQINANQTEGSNFIV